MKRQKERKKERWDWMGWDGMKTEALRTNKNGATKDGDRSVRKELLEGLFLKLLLLVDGLLGTGDRLFDVCIRGLDGLSGAEIDEGFFIVLGVETGLTTTEQCLDVGRELSDDVRAGLDGLGKLLDVDQAQGEVQRACLEQHLKVLLELLLVRHRDLSDQSESLAESKTGIIIVELLEELGALFLALLGSFDLLLGRTRLLQTISLGSLCSGTLGQGLFDLSLLGGLLFVEKGLVEARGFGLDLLVHLVEMGSEVIEGGIRGLVSVEDPGLVEVEGLTRVRELLLADESS
mmetsp:Transcript_17210/g.28455  ORF Transcript_17210/g.28455 Transcript_17210/m.28455 type:complete len:290 (+) Transcript_17210:80-949(+)